MFAINEVELLAQNERDDKANTQQQNMPTVNSFSPRFPFLTHAYKYTGI